MSDDHDDLHDPRMTALLRDWGKHIADPAAQPLFEKPADDSIEFALTEVDREPAAGEASTLIRLPWLRPALALAAAIVLSFSAWWLLQRPEPSGQILAANLSASPSQRVLRDAPGETTFRSGESVYLHVQANGSGLAAVALLDSQMQFVLIPGTAKLDIKKGHNALGPFVLDDNIGMETFFLLVYADVADGVDTADIVAQCHTEIDYSLTHTDTVTQIRTRLSNIPELSVLTVTIQHLPRE